MSLVFTHAAPLGVAVKHDSGGVKSAIRHHAKPVVPAVREQQVPTVSYSQERVVNEVSEEVASEARESVAADNRVQDLAAREHYLAAVLARIESFKFYPLIARRHGLQGRVEVRFRLDAQGMVSDLDITGGHSLFIEAARAAVRSATPLPAATSLDGFPLEVRFQMIFSLQ